MSDIARENHSYLTQEQRIISKSVLNTVNRNQGLLIALDACGGTGKTYVLSTVLAEIQSRGEVALATIMSGLAARLLPNG